jgi:hypothetical protein
MDVQIPVITEKPLAVCGCHKFKIDSLGDHLCTCTDHSGDKKAHDWVVDQLPGYFANVTVLVLVGSGPPTHPRPFWQYL